MAQGVTVGDGVNVLVTGGAGYIGSVLCEHLLNMGFGVTVLDSLVFGQQSLFHLCHYDRFKFVYGDCMNDALLSEILPDVDFIIPLAAVVGAPACALNSWEAWRVNLDAIKMLDSIRSPSQGVVYPTTNSGYGTQTGEIHCTEETPLQPISIYGQTKVNAEFLLLESGNAITLRLATVFGMSPRMRLDLMVNDFVHKAVKTGSIAIFEQHFKRNYVHIRDVADCFVHCINHFDEMKGRPYNVGLDAANLSKGELALKIKGYIPSFEVTFSETREDPDKRNYIVSNERLRKAGFTAKRTLDDGIRELIKGFSMLGREPLKNV